VNKRIQLELELMVESVEQLKKDFAKLSDSVYNDIYLKPFSNSYKYEEKKEVRKILGYLQEWETITTHLEDAVYYESREVKKQGTLKLNIKTQKFSIDCEGCLDFSCSNSLELYLENGYGCAMWVRGSVEHSDKMGGYYFKSNETKSVKLEEGMKARIRL